ncbi:MAG: TIM barrel protein, partial [Gammaproteobacteria bacterium]|nr:TIM barrel protein [Gammaproteobacteria bacterium]
SALEKTRNSLDDTGVGLIDVEALWLQGDDRASDEQKLLVDVGISLGARNVLAVSRHDDYEASLSQFRELCEMAGQDIRINLEFGEFSSIRSLASALDFIAAVDHPAAGVLVDLMHINRSGEALPDFNSAVYSYVQVCDFLQSSKTLTGMDYIEAAVDHRCSLGEGEAADTDIESACRADMDVSLEIRSRALRENFPDPYERAAQIFKRCQRDQWCSMQADDDTT